MKSWEGYEIKEVRPEDKDYPYLLREIPDPPQKLYYKGQFANGKYRALAVVGSRKYSYYGRQVCQELVGKLAEYNIVIVSGLALGIDSIAHQAALDAGSTTWAVLARGLDEVYPYSHRSLANRILEAGGAVFSEEIPGTPPTPLRFPLRNRIIAGLSQGVLVIEAAQRSGTLITACLSLDYGRSVLAVPQNIHNLTGKGTNWLISKGARLVRDVGDILDELGIEPNLMPRQTIKNDLTDGEKKIFEELKRGDRDIEELSKRLQKPIEQITPILMAMVIKGIVKRLGNGRYVV
jgi:DNA processing protein